MSVRRGMALLAAYGLWGLQGGLAARTVETYRYRIGAAEGWLKANRGCSLPFASPKDIKAWLFQLGRSASYRNQCRQALISFYDFLIEREVCETNPAKALKGLPEVKKLPDSYTSEVAERIMRGIKTFPLPYQVMVTLCLWNGLRVTEVRTLQWHMIREDGTLRFIQKGGGQREMPLHDESLKALSRWKHECPSVQWVFPSASSGNSKPVTYCTFHSWLREVGEYVGIEGLHHHALRHTFAVRLYDSTKDLLIVRDALGHATVQTTEIYARLVNHRLKDAIAGFSYQDEPSVSSKDRKAEVTLDG